jgi:3-oxoadipate enol-lactonase
MIAEIGSARIGYDDIGRGSVVVLLHAFPLNRTMWAPQINALARERRCLAIDMRGFGDSTAGGPYTMDRYADDVAEVLDGAGVTSAVVVVGLSMGGYIAFALWRRHAARVKALVLADTRPGADSSEARDRRRELIQLARSQGSMAVAERQVVGLLGKSTRERRPETVAAALTIAQQASVDGIVGALEAMIARPDSTPTVSTISVPTLVIAGAEDVLTPPKEARAMHAAIPFSRLEILEDAGHLSNLEQPAAFNAALSDFLHAVEEAD